MAHKIKLINNEHFSRNYIVHNKYSIKYRNINNDMPNN